MSIWRWFNPHRDYVQIGGRTIPGWRWSLVKRLRKIMGLK